jgi:hypothetical protein
MEFHPHFPFWLKERRRVMHISVAGMSGIRTITNTQEGRLDSISRVAEASIDLPETLDPTR